MGYNAGGLIAIDRETELPVNSLYIGGQVTTIEPDGTGGFFIAGQFGYADDQEAHNILRVNADLTLDTSWNVTTDGLVYTILVEDDRILLGGGFDEVKGFERHGLAAINHDGEILSFSADIGTAPNYNGTVIDMVLTENHIIVSGNFSVIDGVNRENLAALTPIGDVDLGWQADADDQVSRITRHEDRLYITGWFENVNGSNRIAVAALDLDGNVLDFDPGILGGTGLAITVIDDIIYIGGDFEGPTDYLLAVNASGDQVAIAAGEPDNAVTLIRPLNDNILISGLFNNIDSETRTGMALLNGQGELLEGFQTGIQGAFGYEELDNTLLFGTLLTPNYQIVERSNLAKLSSDGNVVDWAPGVNDRVNALALQNGKLYVGGAFTEANTGIARTHLAAFDPATGVLDSDWTPQTNGSVRAMVARGGELHIGGEFTEINGETKSRLATVDANGQHVDKMPDANGIVHTMAQDGGNLYIGGTFFTVNGHSRVKVAAVNSTNGNLLSWHPELTRSSGSMDVNTIDVSGGTVYLGGQFDQANSENRLNLAAYSTAGALLAWDPQADGQVDSLLANSTGVRVSGSFDQVGGTDANGLARVGLGGSTLVAAEGIAPPRANTMIEVEGGFCLGASSAFIISRQFGGGIACLDDDLNWLW